MRGVLGGGGTNSSGDDEWFRGLDLEPALGEASLVLVGRVVDVSETKIVMGGKVESALLQFKFAPLLVLKGVFSRESCQGTLSCYLPKSRNGAIDGRSLRLKPRNSVVYVFHSLSSVLVSLSLNADA